VHLLTDVDDLDDEGTRRRRPWTMPRDIDMLGALVVSVGARLVIIDPMNAVLSTKVDAYRDQDIRVALAPLARVAQETGAAIVLVRHLTKGGGSNGLFALNWGS
jgi:predicted ATP-dependent serine protease